MLSFFSILFTAQTFLLTSMMIGTPSYLRSHTYTQNSKIAVNIAPACYVDTGICKVTWQPDSLRTGSLYAPAQLVLSLIYVGLVYEIPFLDINPVLSLLIGIFMYTNYIYTRKYYCTNTDVSCCIPTSNFIKQAFTTIPSQSITIYTTGAVPISLVAKEITETIIFKDPFVAVGPCPNCGSENRIFFGDVLGVPGDREEAVVKCTNCKTSMTIKRSTLRVSTLVVSVCCRVLYVM